MGSGRIEFSSTFSPIETNAGARYPRRSTYRSQPSRDIRFHPKSSEIEGRDSINAGTEIDLEDFHGPFGRVEPADRETENTYRCSTRRQCARSHTDDQSRANCFQGVRKPRTVYTSYYRFGNTSQNDPSPADSFCSRLCVLWRPVHFPS